MDRLVSVDEEYKFPEPLEARLAAEFGGGGGGTVDAYTKAESDAKYPLKAASYTKSESDAKYPSKADSYTKTESDGRYEPLDSAYTKAEADARYEPIDSAYTKAEADAKYRTLTDSYSRVEVDNKIAAVEGGGGTGGSSMIREVLVGEDINAALAGYEGEVVIQRGVHTTAVPIVQNRRQKVRGEGGGATIIRATATMDALWKVGNGAPADRTHLSDLCLDADGKATIGLDVNIVGTTGNLNGEPDGQAHFERLYIDDATTTGFHARGGDTQAIHVYGVRVRRAGQYGFRIDVGGPDSWYDNCEATTNVTGTGAGFLVGSSNLHFKGCKAWYTRGYGWNIKGTRNVFTDCESQDTRLHGWFIEWDKNQFIGCMADSAGYADVGGTANSADGFYLASGLKFTVMTGCSAFDREQGYAAQQRYGFNMSASTYNIGRAGSANAASAGVDPAVPVMIGPLTGGIPTEANFKNTAGLLNLR